MPEINIRADYRIIASLVEKNASVLDLGCGNGELMGYLSSTRNARVRGVELDDKAILECVSRGLSVSQQEIEAGLSEYGDNSFDYVILNQCLQQVKLPRIALAESLRVGHRTIVGFPNFAHLSSRWQLGVLGKAPVTPSLPFQLYDKPNRHFLSIDDFRNYCTANDFNIEAEHFLNKDKRVFLLPGLMAQIAFLSSAMAIKGVRYETYILDYAATTPTDPESG
jgi:methionine biosynthesis protein MetW